MISNHNFICFGEDVGHTLLSRHHIMKRLAGQNRVLYVESIGIRSPNASSRDIGRILNKMRRWFKGCRELWPNFFALSPVVIPLHHLSPIRKFNQLLLSSQLRFWQWWLGLADPILWIGLPTARSLVDKLNEKLVVYHCADKLTAYVPSQQRATITHLHQEMLSLADITLTPSEIFYHEIKSQTATCHWLSHGVEYDHFAASQAPTLPAAADLEKFSRPILGFFGTIDERWVDFQLLQTLKGSPNE